MHPQTPTSNGIESWIHSTYLEATPSPATPRTPVRKAARAGRNTPRPYPNLYSVMRREMVDRQAALASPPNPSPAGSWTPNPFTGEARYAHSFPWSPSRISRTPGHSDVPWHSPSYPRTPPAARSGRQQEVDPLFFLAAGTPSGSNTRAPFSTGVASVSSPAPASSAAPTGKAVIDDGSKFGKDEVSSKGSDGSEYEGSVRGSVDFEYDMAEEDIPAIKTNNIVHPQQGAADGEFATSGLGIRPFPANRGALLDLLEEGLHTQCLLPSRKVGGAIQCLSNLRLENNGAWAPHGNGCHKTLATEDSYRRHILGSSHLGIGRGQDLRSWILSHRPNALVPGKRRDDLVVVGAARHRPGQ